MRNNYYTETERQELCRSYSKGKESRKEFCEKRGISVKSLSRWLSKEPSKSAKLEFQPVGNLTGRATHLQINLANGLKLETKVSVMELTLLVKELLR